MNKAGNKAICFYFQVHQPFRLKRYRFFNLGSDHYYYDDYTNESILCKVANECYLPTNELLLKLINKYKGRFKVAFSVTGVVINQFKLYAPEVLASFRKLADTGMVEFLAETSDHSLASLKNRKEFERQVKNHVDMIRENFGVEPKAFRNTELIYNDRIGEWAYEMGFNTVLAEGAKHILGWRSPNYLYSNFLNPKQNVLLRNFVLSDDIAFRFSDRSWSAWPLTTDKYANWINKLAPESDLLNVFIDYETFGEHNSENTGIFKFLEYLPDAILKGTPFKFMTPSEVGENLKPVAPINVNTPISWADEERDVTAWMGNELQVAAIDKLYSLADKVEKCFDEAILRNWDYLQTSDHFYYMATKFFSDGEVHKYFNPYDTPYDAFMNYMNVLSDFEIQLNRAVPEENMESKIKRLEWEIKERDEKIKDLTNELKRIPAKTVKKTVPASVKSSASKKEVEHTKAKKKTEKKITVKSVKGKK